MPTSNLSQVIKIMELILMTQPKSLLDVGVGFGKYGFLTREYLELWDGSNQYNDWKRRIDGIEIFPEYLTPVHDYIYDNVYIGNALEILPTLSEKYDLILLVDIIEHFTFEEGLMLIKSTIEHGKNVLISTPKHMAMQGSAFGNPFETHRFQWTKTDFDIFDNKFFIRDRDAIILFMGEFTKILHKSRFNRAIGKRLPFLIRTLRTIKLMLKSLAFKQ